TRSAGMSPPGAAGRTFLSGRWKFDNTTEQGQNGLPVVPRRRAVLPGVPTFRTPLHDHGLPALVERADRFHRSPALRGPVTRADVDVTGPQAVWAVVRIAVTTHRGCTVQAVEILTAPREPRVHLLHSPTSPATSAPARGYHRS